MVAEAGHMKEIILFPVDSAEVEGGGRIPTLGWGIIFCELPPSYPDKSQFVLSVLTIVLHYCAVTRSESGSTTQRVQKLSGFLTLRLRIETFPTTKNHMSSRATRLKMINNDSYIEVPASTKEGMARERRDHPKSSLKPRPVLDQ